MSTLVKLAHDASRQMPDSVVNSLVTDLDLPEDDARDLAVEAVRFLALASRGDELMVPSEPVDAAWHALLLDTRRYFVLCDELGSGYLHHEPASPGDPSMLIAYERTRTAMREAYGSLSERWWGERSGSGRCTCGRRPY